MTSRIYFKHDDFSIRVSHLSSTPPYSTCIINSACSIIVIHFVCFFLMTKDVITRSNSNNRMVGVQQPQHLFNECEPQAYRHGSKSQARLSHVGAGSGSPQPVDNGDGHTNFRPVQTVEEITPSLYRHNPYGNPWFIEAYDRQLSNNSLSNDDRNSGFLYHRRPIFQAPRSSRDKPRQPQKEPMSARQPVCCYFKQKGSCRMGVDCWYAHENNPHVPCHYGASCKAGHAALAIWAQETSSAIEY